MFRKSRSKSESQTEYQCTIRFLDDSEPVQLTFMKDTAGQVILEQVCNHLNLVERDYFGLRFVDSEKQRHWLDPVKTVYKQLKGVSPCVLCFRVKFYPADPMKLHEEITRYYLFLQLRRDLHHGRLLCSPADANMLAAYIIQSELGDYDPQDHPPGYVAEFKMLPKQNLKMEEQILEIHKTLVGQVPAEAEGNFLKKACTLDTYGVDPHQVKDQKGTQLYLGVTHQGIMTFHGSRRTQMYKWTQIKKIAYEGKMFIVHVNITDDEDQTNTKKKHQPVGYKCLTVPACKYLWRCAVEQQFFFTLSNSFHPPKVRSGGNLFSRGSKFRFSGRCQNEAYSASDQIKREEPNFQRSCSLPNFTRRTDPKMPYKSSGTLPDSVKEDKSRRKYNESPVDVPGQPASTGKVESLSQGPIVQAPMAKQEDAAVDEIMVEQAQVVQSSAPHQQTPIPTVNITPATPADVSTNYDLPVYQPEETIMEFDHEPGRPGSKSLEDQVLELEEQFNKLNQEANHVSPVASTPVKEDRFEPTKTNKSESAPNDVKANATQDVGAQKKAASKCSCCRVLVYTFFFIFLTLTVTTIVIMFSNIQHPVVNELRQHLTFLEPARDFIQDKYRELFKKS